MSIFSQRKMGVVSEIATVATTIFVGLTFWLMWKAFRRGKRIWAIVDKEVIDNSKRTLFFQTDISPGEAWIRSVRVSGLDTKIRLQNVHYFKDNVHTNSKTVEYPYSVNIEQFSGDPGHRFVLQTSTKTKKVKIVVSLSVSWKPRKPVKKNLKVILRR